jgi:hypothetical protein
MFKNNKEFTKAREVARDFAIDEMLALHGESVDENRLNTLNAGIEKSAKATQDIEKSANIGYNVDPSTGLTPDANGVGTTAALRRESLANMVRSMTYGTEQFIFYRKLMENAIVSTSTVEQYTVFDHHSEVGHGLTNYEGQVSEPTDPHMVRKIVPIKYLSKTSNITLQAQMVSSIADPVQVYNEDAVTTIISMIEWESFYGDSDLSASPEEKNGTEFDGLVKLIPKENVIDNHGETLNTDALSNAAMIIQSAYGTATDAFMPAGAKAEFVNSLIESKSLQQVGIKADGNSDAYNYGFTISNYLVPSTGLPVSLNGSNVMTLPQQLDPRKVGTAGTALQPKVTSTVNNGDKGAFREKHEVGTTLNYKVTATIGNKETVATDVSAAVTAKDDSVALKITVPSIGENIAEYVSVYRLAEDGYYWLIKRIGIREADDAGTITYVDRNEKIAGTVDVFVGDMSPKVIGLYQLLPLDVLPLARFSASNTWSYLWFGALALFIPTRWVRITNVGTISTPLVR